MKRVFCQSVIIFLFIFGMWMNASGQQDDVKIRQEMEALVTDITKHCHNDYDKAHVIYDWMVNEISYDTQFYGQIVMEQVSSCDTYSEILTGFALWLLIHYPEVDEDETEIDMDRVLSEFVKFAETINFSDFIRQYKKQIRHSEIKDNLEFNRQQLNSGLKVFNERVGICSGIAHLYKIMCEAANIKCDIVCGVVKSYISLGGHAWNAVTIDGKKILVDVTGAITGDESFFDVPPQTFIQTHLPLNSVYQNLESPVSNKMFIENVLSDLTALSPSLAKKMKELDIWTIKYIFKQMEEFGLIDD